MTTAITCGFIQTPPWLNHLARTFHPTTVTELTPPTQERDVSLLKQISNGDRQAFTEFYDLHSGLFFAVAVKILHDQREAEDVLQEVFVQIWEKAGNFDPKLGKPLSWALTFIRNKSIDRIRSSVRRNRLVESATNEAVFVQAAVPTTSESATAQESSQMVHSAVNTLPPDQRQAIELAFFSGLTQMEISEKLKEPLGTIKARIRRGMMKLRDKLEGRV